MNQKQFIKPDAHTLKAQLSDIAYRVTQKNGTEPPFDNEFWNHKEDGIYVDIISGEPLFASTDKFDSGTGWPSFINPIGEDTLTSKTDFKMIYPRKEVRSALADSHLGHVFNDGPDGHKRYCINSAALRFIPKNQMQEAGYEEWLSIFND